MASENITETITKHKCASLCGAWLNIFFSQEWRLRRQHCFIKRVSHSSHSVWTSYSWVELKGFKWNWPFQLQDKTVRKRSAAILGQQGEGVCRAAGDKIEIECESFGVPGSVLFWWNVGIGVVYGTVEFIVELCEGFADLIQWLWKVCYLFKSVGKPNSSLQHSAMTIPVPKQQVSKSWKKTDRTHW